MFPSSYMERPFKRRVSIEYVWNDVGKKSQLTAGWHFATSSPDPNRADPIGHNVCLVHFLRSIVRMYPDSRWATPTEPLDYLFIFDAVPLVKRIMRVCDRQPH